MMIVENQAKEVTMAQVAQYKLNAAGVAVGQTRSGGWQPVDPATGNFRQMPRGGVAAPAANAPWVQVPQAASANPTPQPGPQQQQLPPRQPAQPMSLAQRAWLAFGIVGALALVAIIAIANLAPALSGRQRADLNPPPPATQQPPARATVRPPDGPRPVCLGDGVLYRDARYGGAWKCWPRSKWHLIPPEWIVRD